MPRSKVASTRAFRRVRADRAFGAAGLLLVVFATYLVFNWEAPVVVEPSIGVEWVQTPHALYNETVSLPRADPEFTVDLDIPDVNVTRVTLRVAWKDDVGDQAIEFDQASVNLTSDAATNVTVGVTDAADNVQGVDATRAAIVNDPPTIRAVPARTLADAERLLGDHTARNGTGRWTLTVRLDFVGDDFSSNGTRTVSGTCPAESVPNVCTRDPGQTGAAGLRIAVDYQTYRHQFRSP